MKLLTKIRLIKWHYFEDLTLDIKNSTLFTGENASGKSTILDAIQLVLTTNTRKFNTAANEKSNRDLRGYVRCKVGTESKTYMRSGNVISFVALEFYDDRKKTSFVVGAKLDSPDEESKIEAKFFVEECVLDDLMFIVDKHVVTDKEFIRNGKRIDLLNQKIAKERIQKRLGHLDSKFFELIPKSLAFKPMDNVKDFMNKFMLEENNVDVERLRDGIKIYREFKALLEETKKKIEVLDRIIKISDEIAKYEKEAKSIEILILKAKLEFGKEKLITYNKELAKCKSELKNLQTELDALDSAIKSENTKINALKSDDRLKLLEAIKENIKSYEKDKTEKERLVLRLKQEVEKLANLVNVLGDHKINRSNILELSKTDLSNDEKFEAYSKIKSVFLQAKERYSELRYTAKDRYSELSSERSLLVDRITALKKKQFTYPIDSIQKLKDSIEREFKKRDIKSNAAILCELLEVTDPQWSNAVEGYLGYKRFDILVESQFYEIASEIYIKMKNEIHTVGLINMNSIDLNKTAIAESLASVVHSKSRHAQSYINYLLSGVVCCEKITDIKNHETGITKGGLVYQNHTISQINSDAWATPFIGATAYERQLLKAEDDLKLLDVNMAKIKKEQDEAATILKKFDECRIDIIGEDLYEPYELMLINVRLEEEIKTQKEAEKNPDLISTLAAIEKAETNYKSANKKRDEKLRRQGECDKESKDIASKIVRQTDLNKQYEDCYIESSNKYFEEAKVADEKLKDYLKSKRYEDASINFEPRLQTLKNQKETANAKLRDEQQDYNRDFRYDFPCGYQYMSNYIDERFRQVNSKIVEYEEDLKKAEEGCEKEFRDSFLSEMREHIERAQAEFKDLNDVLKNVDYGGEYYKFEITANKSKEQLHRMITSEFNEGYSIFSGEFEKKYKDEIDDLFAKLTVSDDSGEKTLKEYSDYRNYLDYDIEVTKNGEKYKFSKIYAEKSGGETQTPYYVAIAASFRQIYNSEDTIRIIMLDEAFDKMDDGRIDSMMKFFTSLGFQIIMATPPAKMEVIGEAIETILLVQRIKDCSIVSKYELGADN